MSNNPRTNRWKMGQKLEEIGEMIHKIKRETQKFKAW